MFVELIDQLRCPAAHTESWLVLFADESRDRHIIRGTLGCPVCGARYRIEDGTVWFVNAGRGPGTAGGRPGAGDGGTAGSEGRLGTASAAIPLPTPYLEVPAPAPGPRSAVLPLPPTALAAFLDLAEPGGIVALFGAWAGCAEELGDVVEQVELVVIAPPHATHPMQSAIMPPSRAQVPLADGSLRAAAVDLSDDAAAVTVEAARLVRTRGRILAPASAPVPAGVHEITRDETWWIGEREAGSISGIIPLGVRRSQDF